MTPEQINNIADYDQRIQARRQFVRELRQKGQGTEDIAVALFDTADMSTCNAVRDLLRGED